MYVFLVLNFPIIFNKFFSNKWVIKEKREYKNDVGDKEQNKILLEVERAEGKEEGIAIGREIGKVEERKRLALKLLLKGMSEKDIMTLTELSMEEIEELKNK